MVQVNIERFYIRFTLLNFFIRDFDKKINLMVFTGEKRLRIANNAGRGD